MMQFPIIIPAIGGAIITKMYFDYYVNSVTDEVRWTFGLSYQEGNAFGHAFASSLLTSRYGETLAKAAGDLRELFGRGGRQLPRPLQQ